MTETIQSVNLNDLFENFLHKEDGGLDHLISFMYPQNNKSYPGFENFHSAIIDYYRKNRPNDLHEEKLRLIDTTAPVRKIEDKHFYKGDRDKEGRIHAYESIIRSNLVFGVNTTEDKNVYELICVKHRYANPKESNIKIILD